MAEIVFTVYTTPAPQGSHRAFVAPKTGKAFVTQDNKKTVPYRQDVTRVARYEMAQRNMDEPMAAKHVPVELRLEFTLLRPASVPKSRIFPSVKPDLDKLVRATKDALKGVLYVDDGQVVDMVPRKRYGPIEQVRIHARVMGPEDL